MAGNANNSNAPAASHQALRQPTAAARATNSSGSKASPVFRPSVASETALPRCPENQRAITVKAVWDIMP